MILARVIGPVVATAKHPKLAGRTLFVVRPANPAGAPAGRAIVALDCVQAGPGDLVLVNDEGNSARLILADALAPVRTMIVGIVDQAGPTIELEETHGDKRGR